MLNGPTLAVALAVALTYLIGVQAVHGVEALGHQMKRAGHAIVRLVHHPKEEEK